MLAEPHTDALLPTRRSLLSRLRDWQDQAGWREFFETYWRLIYSVARRAGLNDSEAEDVVQNTFLYLARRMPGFRYDPARGSFKSWLRVVTRSRISEYRRKAAAERPRIADPLPTASDAAAWEEIPDPAGDALDEIWQREWEENLVNAAFRRVRAKVSAQQLMIFRLAALGDLPLRQVAKKLGISLAQVYLARHRVGKLFRTELAKLRTTME